MKGYIGAILEVLLFALVFGCIVNNSSLSNIETVTCYWLGFTVMTGFWEVVYLSNRKNVRKISDDLVKSKTHVWTSEYGLSMLLPWNLAGLFYAEYGAWADREYMFYKDNWSFVVEGTHCTVCAAFSLCALCCMLCGDNTKFLMTLCLAMGAQWMNSAVYLGQYWDQCEVKESVNYNSDSFPCGRYLMKRAFMWVNVFWLLMPTYVMYVYLTA